MLAVASGILAIIVSVFMQREGVVAIQVIAYGIWFFLSKYVNHYPPGRCCCLTVSIFSRLNFDTPATRLVLFATSFLSRCGTLSRVLFAKSSSLSKRSFFQ